jgi:hypothetical protein
MLQPRSALLSNYKRCRSSTRYRRQSSQSTGWTYNAKQLPATARYTETQSGVTSSASTFTFSYNALGNLTQFTQLIAGGALETGKLTNYNANGAFLAGISTIGERIAHTYTPRGQLATTSITTPAVPAVAATATTPFKPRIPAKTALTNYTYDAIGQSKQVSYPNGDTLVYTYSPAHKLLGMKWNGIEQYTPVAGISGNLAALAGYSGITNPELAYKLGVNSNTLDMLDAAPKVLTESANAAAFRAVELAKETVIGREAWAQIVFPSNPLPALGGSSSGWGLPRPSGGFDELNNDGTYMPYKYCPPGDDDYCQKLRKRVQKAKNDLRVTGACGKDFPIRYPSIAERRVQATIRFPIVLEAATSRSLRDLACKNTDVGEKEQEQNLWEAVATCAAYMKI